MRRTRGPSDRRSLLAGATTFAAVVALTACGGSSEVASSTVATVASTVETSAPTAPDTTAPATSAPTTAPPTSAPATTAPTTAPPTTAPATTTPPVTTSPPTSPPTTPPTPPPGPMPSNAFLTADDRLTEVDAATGTTIRVLDELFSGDGLFRGGLRLSPDRNTIWYNEGYEDSWYSCEASVGSWGRVDVATGTLEMQGSGSGVAPSADGRFVSYVTSNVCVPDPDQPDIWVLTPPDRVVVRELATGEEREFVTEPPPADYAAPTAVSSAIFGPTDDLLVLLADGRLFDVDLNGSSVIQDHPVVLEQVPGAPLSAAGETVISVDFGEEGSTDLYALDLTGGAPTLIASAGAFMAVGVSTEGHVIVSSFEPITVAPGAVVTLLELPGDEFVFDLVW